MLPTPANPNPADAVTVALLRAGDPRVLVAAHRGAWEPAPENSLAAIAAAVDVGADIVELDVRATADEVLVLLHDATLDRTSNGRGALHTYRHADLRGLTLRQGNGHGKPLMTGEAPPTLASALEAARDRIIVNVDAKEPHLAERIARFVVAAGMSHQVFVKAEVAGLQDIERVRRNPVFRKVPFVPMISARRGRFADDLRALQVLDCPMVEVSFSALDDLAEGRDELRRQGARLWVNTIAVSHSLDYNDARALREPDAVWGPLLDIGVGAIQTDEVPQLLKYLQSKGRR
jgi:glycerophosphoryl diester phosphodiesterase